MKVARNEVLPPATQMIDSGDSPQTSSRIVVADELSRPTRVRWHVMALLVIVSALTFLDRLNLSIAGKFIQDEFHLPNQTMGWILSAFVLGYALFQVPGGWLADRYGRVRTLQVAASPSLRL